MALCSGRFQTQPLNLKDLEGSQASNYEEPNLSLSEDFKSGNESQKKSSKILDSSDDEQEDLVPKRTWKRNLKVSISDDEDEEDIEQNGNEKEEEFQDEDQEDVNEEEIGKEYDENESVIDEEAEEERVDGVGFLDAEAELSGSDWESADEDEKDLDDLEMEQADEEDIDHSKLQRELGRIHVKEMISEDKKEIRMLQELLFEDGDLHSDGPKRQRLYRWSNSAQFDDYGNKKILDGLDPAGGNLEEDEEEEVWRRLRHERESFLKNNSKRDDSEEEFEEPVVKTVGLKPTPKPQVPKNAADLLESPDPKHPFKLITKRGSFLSRGASVLSRLAELASGGSGAEQALSKGKRKMVFAAISPPKETPPEQKDKDLKRKAVQATPKVSKKLKYSSSSGKKGVSILEQLRQSDINVS